MNKHLSGAADRQETQAQAGSQSGGDLEKGLKNYLNKITKQLLSLPISKWHSSGELITEAGRANRPIIQSEYMLYQALADRFLILRASQSVRSKKQGDIYSLEPLGEPRYFVYLPELGVSVDALRANLELSANVRELPDPLLSGEPAKGLFQSIAEARQHIRTEQYEAFRNFTKEATERILSGNLEQLNLEDLQLQDLHGAKLAVSCSLLKAPEELGKILLHCSSATGSQSGKPEMELVFRSQHFQIEMTKDYRMIRLVSTLINACHLKSVSSLSKELDSEMKESQ